jgi:hypothetical protein
MFLYRVIESLEKNTVDYALVGGFAVALHGAVRGTVDIDLILRVTEKNFVALEAAMSEMGLVPRLPITAKDVFHFRKEYIEKRNLVAWSFVNPGNPIEIVDVILTDDLKGAEIKRIRSGKYTINILAIKPLIQMKKRSGRPQDLEDARALEEIGK